MNRFLWITLKIVAFAFLLFTWSLASFAGVIEDDKDRWKEYFVDVDVTETAYQWFLPFESSERNTINNLRVVSTFGSARYSYVSGHIHTGLDCDPKTKTPTEHVYVYAMAKGRVCSIHLGDPHKTIVVKHKMPDSSTIFTSYKHLESIYLNVGDTVDRHSKLGRLYTRKEAQAQGGNYDHLHLEVRKRFDDYAVASWATMSKAELDLRFINPYTFLKKRLPLNIPKVLMINPQIDKQDRSLVEPIIDKIQANYKLQTKTVHYKEVSANLISTFKPNAMIIAGQTTPWHVYNKKEFDALKKVLQTYDQPVLGICGGHQLLALMNNGKVALIKGKDKVDTYEGCYREEGLIKTMIIKEDMLLEGFSKGPMFFASHYEEIKTLPENYILLLKGEKSKYQMIKHKIKPIYGVQFHPEWATKEQPDGMILLINFMKKVLVNNAI